MSTRRKIRFESIAQALADVDHLIASEKAGTLSHAGNWTLGQALNHLAVSARLPLDGYPPQVRAGPVFRFFARLIKRRVLRKGMIPGMKFRKLPGGTFATEDVPAEQAAGNLRRAYERLGAQAPAIANPIFGVLTHEEWIAFNLRHAELHLSFQIPGSTD